MREKKEDIIKVKESASKSSGDEQIDALIKNGTIVNFKTCCNNSIYGDHNVEMTLKDGKKIFSYASMISKSLIIDQQNNRYVREVDDTLNLVNLLTSFGISSRLRDQSTSESKEESQDASASMQKKFIYYKMRLANGNPVEGSRQSITENTFMEIFNTMPKAVQTALNRRETRGQSFEVIASSNDSNEEDLSAVECRTM